MKSRSTWVNWWNLVFPGLRHGVYWSEQDCVPPGFTWSGMDGNTAGKVKLSNPCCQDILLLFCFPPHLFKMIHLLLWGVCTRPFFSAEVHPSRSQSADALLYIMCWTLHRTEVSGSETGSCSNQNLKTYSISTHSLLPSLMGVQSTGLSTQDKTPWNVYTDGSQHWRFCGLLLTSIIS